jgi:adenylate cyclase
MTTQELKRKLTAILSADVKGYSRLMGEDEEWTVRTLKVYKDVMGSLIQQHRGRVVDATGDNLMAEFASVVDAVQCAVEIQQVLRAKNALLPETRRMEFRIGINLGDVIEEGERIYGDGVNIAARLEGLAEAGGICISGSAYEQIENKLPLRYEYLGEHEVKNIAKPVRVYCARIEADAGPSKLGKEKKPVGKRLSKAALAIVAVVVIAGAVILYQFVLRPSPSKTEVASKEKMAFPLPDKPSIAVLPFVNMSEDPKQEFLCDGITEEIITALTKVRDLFVISRQSTFTYKGKPVKVKQVSEELGVRYVLEGSVQRSGDRIRITAQLIDALTGNHLWAERYERDLKDVFALQDEITMKVLTATQVKLTTGEEALTSTKYFRGKQGLDCYLKYLEGLKYFQGRNIEDNRMARRIAEEAIAMCPEFPMAYVLMAWVHVGEYWLGSGKSPRESIEKGIEMAQKALALDDSIASAHGLLGHLYALKREHDKAIAELERAVALDPGGAEVHMRYAMSLMYVGRSEEAIAMCQKAIRLNPFAGTSLLLIFANALRDAKRFEEAVSEYRKALQREPNNIFAHTNLAGTYIMMGREKEARAEAAEVLRINPKFSVDFWAKAIPYKDQSVTDKYIDALRKAGLK